MTGITVKASGAKRGPEISIPPTIILHENQNINFSREFVSVFIYIIYLILHNILIQYNLILHQ